MTTFPSSTCRSGGGTSSTTTTTPSPSSLLSHHNNSHNSWVFAVGCNQSGRLASGSSSTIESTTNLVPSKYFENQIVVKVISQAQSTIFLTANGRVYLAGAFCAIPVSSVRNVVLASSKDDPNSSSSEQPQQQQQHNHTIISNYSQIFSVPFLFEEIAPYDVIDADCGQQHLVFLTRDNQVLTCGSNSYFELGDSHPITSKLSLLAKEKLQHTGSGSSKSSCLHKFNSSSYGNRIIQQVLCGSYFTILRADDNSLYCCGSNFHGQLGCGMEDRLNSLTLNDYFSSRYLNIECIDSGSNHTVVLTCAPDNGVYVIGYNSEGQLGLSHKDRVSQFNRVERLDGKDVTLVRCGFMSTIALTRSGDLYGFGKSLYGHLGSVQNTLEVPFKIDVGIIGRVRNVHMGNFFTILQTDTGDCYGLGNDSNCDFGVVNPRTELAGHVPKRIPLEHMEQLCRTYHLQLSIFCAANGTFFVLNDQVDVIRRNFNLEVFRNAKRLTNSIVEIVFS